MRLAGLWASGVLAVAVTASGCLFVGTGGSKEGIIRFKPTFGGVESCMSAGVTKVRTTVTSTSSSTALTTTESDCSDGAVEVKSLPEGEYKLRVEGLNSSGQADYSVDRVTAVLAGQVTDLDRLNLTVLYAAVLVDWKFSVAATGGSIETPNCERAGVVDLVVELSKDGEVVLRTDPWDCTTPLQIADTAPGSYTLNVDAYGSYNGIPILLYQASNVPLEVTGAVADTGQILLQPNNANFGALDVSVLFEGGGTCTSNSASQIFVDVFQGNLTDPVDSFRFECPAVRTTRTLMVPGNQRVVMRATAGAVMWTGSANTNVAPGQTVAVPVTLSHP